jgi:hypothetical protein
MVLTDAVFHAARFWLKAVAIVIWRPLATLETIRVAFCELLWAHTVLVRTTAVFIIHGLRICNSIY